MKILIIAPRQLDIDKSYYCYMFPLGLAYISSVLKTKYKVDTINLNHLEGATEDLVRQALSKEDYDVVCTGHMTNGYSIIKKIIDTTRDYNPKIKIILGGIIVTSESETMFNLLNPDFAVIGEGEETIIDLLDSIKKNKNLEKVKGIAFRDKNGRLIFTEKREPPKDLDKIPFPDLEGFDFLKIFDNLHPNDFIFCASKDYPRYYPILASRGCPFNCTFCHHNDRYRKRSVDNIMKELEIVVKKYKINILYFYDDCIASDKKRLYELCERIKKLNKEVPWEIKASFQMTVRDVDRETLKKMKEVGVNNIRYGFESFSPIILKSMNKFITPEAISKAFHETVKAKISIEGNFIFGDVAETKETARETLEWWKKYSKGQITLGLVSPYPGSALYDYCLKNGIIKDKIDFIKNHISEKGYYNMSSNLNSKEFEQLKEDLKTAYAKYCKRTIPLSIKRTGENLYEIKIKCPFCKSIITYKNCFIEKRFLFDFPLMCRECHLCFNISGLIPRLIYFVYPLYRIFRKKHLGIKYEY